FRSVTRALHLEEIQARMPANAQVIQYAVLNDKVLIWCVTKNSFSTVERNISQRDLEKLVSDYVQAIASRKDKSDVQQMAKKLYEILISPAENVIDPQKAVFLI